MNNEQGSYCGNKTGVDNVDNMDSMQDVPRLSHDQIFPSMILVRPSICASVPQCVRITLDALHIALIRRCVSVTPENHAKKYTTKTQGNGTK
eukprot:5700911-Amphidinium_carterae.1